MRRTRWIAVTVLVLLAGVAIAVGAYNAGVTHGLAQAANGTEVVRVVGPGYGYGWGFFPRPPPAPADLLLLRLVRRAFWGRRWGGPGHGGYGGPATLMAGRDGGVVSEDWHRRQHEQSTGDKGPGRLRRTPKGPPAGPGGRGHLPPPSVVVTLERKGAADATILVVEDEMKIARLVRDYLEHAGFDVMVAGDGEAPGRRPRREARPVVLDLGLPGRDGLDVTRELRRTSTSRS